MRGTPPPLTGLGSTALERNLRLVQAERRRKEILQLRSELRSLEGAKERGEKELEGTRSPTRVELGEQAELVQALEEQKRREEHLPGETLPRGDATELPVTGSSLKQENGRLKQEILNLKKQVPPPRLVAAPWGREEGVESRVRCPYMVIVAPPWGGRA